MFLISCKGCVFFNVFKLLICFDLLVNDKFLNVLKLVKLVILK